uniref:Uncharacterized protein n=1 Tax=Panagrolaimus superbus TaxID=310955 RepID=A0A914XZ28_9BILA
MSSQFGGSENEKRMQEQFIFSTITFFGVLTILFLSLITCGKGRTPITSSAATKTKKPSKNVQDDDEQKSEKRKPSKKTENTMKTQSETLKTESSPASSAIAADSKLQKLAKKKTVATTQEGSELVTPLSKSETIELSNTQALSNATNQSSIRSTKEKKSTNIAAAADKNNNINKQKSNGPIKDTGLNANEIPSNRSLNTARQQQQPSTRAQSTQNTTHEESSQKQSQKHKSEDQ